MLDHIAPIHEKSINTIVRINLFKIPRNGVQMNSDLGNDIQIIPNEKVHEELVSHVSKT